MRRILLKKESITAGHYPPSPTPNEISHSVIYFKYLEDGDKILSLKCKYLRNTPVSLHRGFGSNHKTNK